MAKRTNGEGTIYQDKKGLWIGELTLGYEDGKRDKRRFTSMDIEVVKKKMNDEKYLINRNIVTANSDFTLKEWLEFWLVTYKKNSVKPRTYDYYESNLRLYAYSNVGDIKLNKFKPEHIQQLYNLLYKKGLSTSTIKGVHIPLNQAFDQAIVNELVYKNPCKHATIPKKEPRKSRAMTIEEQKKLVSACGKSTYHDFFLFLLNTGLRCGEGLALTWDDIDDDVIIINKGLTTIINRNEEIDKKYNLAISTPKTESGSRTIPLNKTCKEILLKRNKDDIFVFSSNRNTALGQRNAGRAFCELLEKAELKEKGKSGDLTIHSLRHTFATRLLEKGANIKAVSELLGHKSIQITLDRYE